MNLIGMSTGCLNSWYDFKDDQISIIKGSNLEAIEISFEDLKSLDEEISEENLEYIRKSKYVCIHSLIYSHYKNLMVYKDNQETRDILKKLETIYKKLNAQAIVFHPSQVEDYHVLEEYNFNVCMENQSMKDGSSVRQLQSILKHHPKFKLVIDTFHDFSDLIEHFRDKIQHIHLNSKEYDELTNACLDMSSLKELKTLNLPIIIGLEFNKFKFNLLHLTKEIHCVKEYFK